MSLPNNHEWILTRDGSYTLLNKDIDEIYHSRFGALSECQHVYLNPWLACSEAQKKNKWRVLDVGFGLGLNWLTYVHHAMTHQQPKQLEITSLEHNDALLDIFLDQEEMGLTSICPQALDCIKDLKQFSIVKNDNIHARLILSNVEDALEEFVMRDHEFDVILFDPFAPEKNQECWTESVFHKIASCCHENSVLMTYSVAKAVKHNLKQAGFEIAKRSGFGFKREQLIAFYKGKG